MKNIISLSLILILVSSVLFISGCGETTTNPENSENDSISNIQNIFTQPQTVSKEPSELTLQLSDLPTGYQIKVREDRLKSDVKESSISLGWQKGYHISFIKGEGLQISTIEQWVSIYPLENISKMVSPEDFVPKEGWTMDEMPNLNIGDKSYVVRYKENEFGFTNYDIGFIKKNVYVRLVMYGSITDYELFKELAKKAADKI